MKKLTWMFAFIGLFSPAFAAITDISNLPIEKSAIVKPNVILGIDDSGSMDFEVIFPTNDGALWWNTSTQNYLDAGNNLLFNASGNVGNDGSNYWVKYVYLFPNGVGADNRMFQDSWGYAAIPPIPQFAFARSYQYNSLYYNPTITYKPWSPAYYSGITTTFLNAVATVARSHPIFPDIGIPDIFNLTLNNYSQTSNYIFLMQAGMVIPGATISGITAQKYGTGQPWSAITSNFTIPVNQTYSVAIPYYPATYYVQDPTCTTGVSCATAPDGKALRRYEIKVGNTYPSGRTYVDELQNFANWFVYHRKRKLLLGSAMSNVLPTLQGIRGGGVYFNNQANVTMYDFDTTADSTNERSLIGMIYRNASFNGTPTRETLKFIGEQYRSNSITQYGCQMNAAMIMTDGFANGSNVSVPNYSQATYGGVQPYQTTYSGSLADIALAYYTMNIRPDLPSGLMTNGGDPASPNYDTNTNPHMTTYGLTLGVKGYIFGTGSAADTAPFTTFPSWVNPGFDSDQTSIDDLWHASINGRGLLFNSANVTDLSDSILHVFSDLLIKAGSSSAVGVVQTYITSTDNLALLASYLGFTGDLQEIPIDPSTGNILTAQMVWSAQALLDTLAPTSRIIATYTGASGIPFQWASLPLTQQTLLNMTLISLDGQNVLNYLRGVRTNEGTTYRTRTHILGDIDYAEPVVVKGAMATYADTGYAAFANNIANRPPVIYQAANDGMLHAFDKDTGQERWAYIPKLVFSNLKNLADPNYIHRFYVDGTPTAGDVYISSTWKTLLVGGFRAGGNGYYALDVTDPASMTSESAVASKVMWEFPNNSTSLLVSNNIGLSFGRPLIVKTNAAGWVVLVTSGYNNSSGDGQGHLFVLNAQTGALIKDISTGQGSVTTPSGLAQLAAYTTNSLTSSLATHVYGGDLLGNVWRFDLSDPLVANWNVKLLAKLVDGTGKAQPITTEPEIGVVNGQRFVYVGTGRLLGVSDISDTSVQSMYGLVDNLSATPTITPLRTKLIQRVVNGLSVDGGTYSSGSFSGWYLDFPGSGERMNVNPVLVFGTLLFNTNQPSPSACGSQSYQYALSTQTGLALPASAFASGVTPWARRLVGSTLVSKPTVVVLANGRVISLSHKSDNTIDNNQVPQSAAGQVNKVAWKEIMRQ